ncbi:MAG: hypothetical protein COB67_00020 [SAR324 cluster bacterium]|uniref:Uncharacterized protein n=1 Tax=SAR324 cluster bacterium TaxID=2024889 RepID=A0A2A4TCL9_9DELT|nr:MAG: hypothetical protein COB67_00020 [SAR324 cluster bacterium]
MKKIELEFVFNVFAHVRDKEGDLVVKEKEHNICASNYDIAEERFMSQCSFYYEPGCVKRFYDPIGKQWHDMIEYDSLIDAINAQITIEEEILEIRLDKEMPFLQFI